MKDKSMVYCGFNEDTHGITMLGRVVLDAWLFNLIPRDEDCAGWDLPRLQNLMNQNEEQWDQYGNLPSRLPDELRQRHAELYAWATARGRERGWDPELGEDE
ncbi:MAG: hypothetical protein Q8O33_13575 [Pseudomonadota bacterium]|nr:hypothetical protein [Pseudomonadota bacterium]